MSVQSIILGRVARANTACRQQATACGQAAPHGAPTATPANLFHAPKTGSSGTLAPANLFVSSIPDRDGLATHPRQPEDPHVRLTLSLFAAAALILVAQMAMSCVRVEAYRVTGGIGKMDQRIDDAVPAAGSGAVAGNADKSSGTAVATTTSGSIGTVNIVTGSDNTQEAGKATSVDAETGIKADAKARDVQVTPGGGLGK